MLTRSLAKDLGPDIRVNGVSPGAIFWPDEGQGMSDALRAGDHRANGAQAQRRARGYRGGGAVPRSRRALRHRARIIAVDGGRSIGR